MNWMRSRSTADWIISGLSVLIVGALVVYAISEEVERRDADPANVWIAFDVGNAVLQNGTYFVPYTVTNSGASAVDSADLAIDIVADGEMVDSTEIAISSLPLDGRQRGVFATRFDPADYELQGRVVSILFP
ncbi:MAG: hypothetical protein QM692_11890 [Thermomicrobiales bacterium]